MVSIRDVARKAGVSHQTVSNAINSPNIVSAATRAKIQEAIKELGYKPNASARRLRSGRSDVVAVGISAGKHRAPSPIFDEFLHLLAAEANVDGKQIMLYPRIDEPSEIRHIESLMEQSDVDAIVLNELEVADGRPRWLIEHHQPFVLFGRPWNLPAEEASQIPWVDVDGYSAIKEMTRRLIEAGRRHIGYIGWNSGTGTAINRYAGWHDALVEAGLIANGRVLGGNGGLVGSGSDAGSAAEGGVGAEGLAREERSAGEKDFAGEERYDDTPLSSWAIGTVEAMRAGEEAAAELYERHPELDAIVCPSDNLAVGALSSISHIVKHAVIDGNPNVAMLSRPVWVTGFDNSAIAKAFSFPSIQQPLDVVARELLRMTRDVLDGKPITDDENWHKLLQPELVWRNSPYETE
ncbi:LacI family DNA-binding transcriptional regulator [Bifidobacterium simiarum]|uniref:LacI family DNA-binding transcriptional regulator n=1 Tax=Bifidobacterium simiarum TaxID=2045441 RepID=UPI001BDDAF2C|nr:LacI family DNA-binding transcriptional regulator [Bifidobacterium simiarum]MBT1166637.1 LacI family DNA-binding transcriptional regulator [Bifidobacterium simiarum]